jgi:tetratricopeptide (TPR) repeat protein
LPFILSGLVTSLYPKKLPDFRGRALPLFAIMYTGVFCFLISIDGFSYIRKNIHFGVQITEKENLESAANFLTANGLTEKVFATPEFSNYMLWYAPGFKTYIDTRYAEVVPKNHFIRLFQYFLNPIEIELETKKYGIRTIAINHTLNNYHTAIQYFQNSPNWHLAYFDHFMVVFLQKGFHEELTASPSKVAQVLSNEVQRFENLSSKNHSDFAKVYQVMVGASVLGQSEFVTDLLPKVLGEAYVPFQKLYCSMMTYKISQVSSNKPPEETILRSKDACKIAYDIGDDPGMGFNLGVAYAHLNNPQEALKYMKEASALRSNLAPYYVAIAGVLASYNYKENFPEIEKNYLKALDLNPFQIDTWISLSLLYEDMGKKDTALKNYEKAASFNKNDKKLFEALNNFRTRNQIDN